VLKLPSVLLKSENQPWAVLFDPVVLKLSALTFSAALLPLPRSSPAKGVGDGLGVEVGVEVEVGVGVEVAVGAGVGLRSLSARALCENAKQASVSNAIAVVILIDVFICFFLSPSFYEIFKAKFPEICKIVATR
jgi:hypothetical protein